MICLSDINLDTTKLVEIGESNYASIKRECKNFRNSLSFKHPI